MNDPLATCFTPYKLEAPVRTISSMTLAVVLLAGGAAAQPAQPTHAVLFQENEVRPGEKVRVTTTDGSVVSGRLLTLTAAAITIDTRNGAQVLPSNRVARLVVKDSVRNGALIGLVAGAAAGLAGGAAINAICVNETGGCPGTILLLTAIGALGGAGIGAGIDGLRHRTLFDSMPQVPGEYSPELMVNVGFGRSGTLGRATTGPPSAGLSWAMRHSSGFGLALDANRTFAQSVRTVPCANARTTLGSVKNCVGEAREGVEGTTTASAVAQYYFARSHVQPYASAGVALYQQLLLAAETVQPFRPELPFALQTSHRVTGVALVAGGGVRIAFGRHGSIRPDISLYKGERWTHVRVSVGAGVGW